MRVSWRGGGQRHSPAGEECSTLSRYLSRYTLRTVSERWVPLLEYMHNFVLAVRPHPSHSHAHARGMRVACVCACMHACVRACVLMCVRARTRR